MEGVDEPELLDGGQRGAVAELDRAGANPDGRGRGRGEGEDDGRGRAGHARVEVVLGEPVAGVAEALGLAGKVDAVAQGLGGGAAGGDGHEVEDGERRGGHGGSPGAASPRGVRCMTRGRRAGGS